MPLIDSFNRTIDYLRISVTDRCNFRCIYCMPEEGAPVAPKHEILTFEEIERLARIAVESGITKIRLTGGEPLVRRDIALLVDKIGRLPGLTDFSLTTNGFLLAQYAEQFAASGLTRVNISLDTLRQERFAGLARNGDLTRVMAGIEAAFRVGLTPVKLNCVVMKGWNEDEAVDFARLTLTRPFHIRFIELMPINWSQGEDTAIAPVAMPGYLEQPRVEQAVGQGSNHITLFSLSDQASFRKSFHLSDPAASKGMLDAKQMRQAFVSTEETRHSIEAEFGPLVAAATRTNGPARTFAIPGAVGTIGFISQITNDMCKNCNRLRLTADGQLRPCLMADGEVDLKTPLRSGAADADIEELFRITVFHKPFEHRLENGLAPTGRNMSQLGG